MIDRLAMLLLSIWELVSRKKKSEKLDPLVRKDREDEINEEARDR